MAQLNPNPPFTSWSLTSQEILQGSILQTLQKQCIQNQISSYAMERLALDIDPSNVLGAVQAEAAIKGAKWTKVPTDPDFYPKTASSQNLGNFLGLLRSHTGLANGLPK